MPRKLKRNKRKLKRRKSKSVSHAPVDFISSGSTVLNCALSGKGKHGGWARGRVLNIAGDKSAGKTVLALEACFSFFKNIKKIKSPIFPKVKSFEIVYNNSEGVMDFDLEAMYGKKFVKNLQLIRSKTVEHFGRDYARRVDNLEKGQALIYVVDTLDFLKSRAALDRFDDSVDDDEDMVGSYDTEKQKYLSTFFAKTSEFLDKNEKDATLIVVSQIRAKIGAKFGKQTMRTGGKAFDHAIHQEVWIREAEKLRMTRKKQNRVYGIRTACRVEKNKCAKPYREAEFIILYDYGIDNLSSMIKWLYGNKQIKFDGKTFKTKKTFIKFIEDNNYERLLEEQVEIRWQEIEEAFVKEVDYRKKRWK
jgi:recombination protein RecA